MRVGIVADFFPKDNDRDRSRQVCFSGSSCAARTSHSTRHRDTNICLLRLVASCLLLHAPPAQSFLSSFASVHATIPATMNSSPANASPVVVIGGGLAGLVCARVLVDAGLPVTLLESADHVGGRVASDAFDGFIFDRGFAVYLTDYPMGKRFLDLPSLNLHPFEPAARIWFDNAFHTLADPLRRPRDLFSTLASPVATFSDLFKLWRLTRDVRSGSPESLLLRPQTSTIHRLAAFGFSTPFIDRFFKPFYGGIFLESELLSSSRAFDFTFRMFADGSAAIPRLGMRAIPQQLAARLPAHSIRLNTPVRSIAHRLVVAESGESFLARAIVVATDGNTAARLVPDYILPPAFWTGTTCLYFAAPASPVGHATLVLNGSGHGIVNNLAVLTDACPSYSSTGRSLISVSIIGTPSADDQTLFETVRSELRLWFGPQVNNWTPLRAYRIPRSLPAQTPGSSEPIQKNIRIRPGLYACGDYLDSASINGAMSAGLRAAEAVLADA